MEKFSNNRVVNLNMLKESSIYSDILLNEIKNGHYEILEELLSEEERNNREFMEPILYAVKNEYGTYKIYKYYGSKLQEDIELAKDIIVNEPELIEGTLVSNNKQFILEVTERNPRVVQYMSQNLKSDSTFIEELCERNDKEVIMYAAKECKMPETIIDNPNLAGKKEFMIECVRQDVNTLEYAQEELKNDYNFMREVSKDKDAIDYVVNHMEDFGEQGLSGTKDALVEISSDEAITGFEEEKEKIKEQIRDNSDSTDEIDELMKRNKQLQRHIRFFERIKSGEIDPVKAAKLIDKICVNLDERYKEEIKQLLKLDEAIIEKQKESKEIKEQNGFKIEPQNIERTDIVTLKGIQSETDAIRTTIIKEKEPKGNEIGENTDDKSDEQKS